MLHEMGRVKCCDPNCENSQQCDVKLFKFPLYNRQKLKKWLGSMQWEGWSPSSFSALCIKHFEEHDIDRTGRTVMLRENAVPTIFSVPVQNRKLKPLKESTENLTRFPKTLMKKQQASTSEAPQTESANALPTAALTTELKSANALPTAALTTELKSANAMPTAALTTELKSANALPTAALTTELKSANALPTAALTTELAVENHECTETNEQSASNLMTQTKGIVLMDEALARIHSFPYFFHGDYCTPQDILWASNDDGDDSKIECEGPRNIIKVQEPWQWLVMDVRGPLHPTQNEHKYIFTVTDLYSKWVEALPMESCFAAQVAQHISDIVSHFGYPFRILSRLPRGTVDEINVELKNMLKITVPLVVYHQQTGTLDLMTQQLINSMVRDLVQQHSCDWDIYLPAKVFALCLKEHSNTKERPFSLLCCKGLQPVTIPRALNYAHSDIQDSVFVVEVGTFGAVGEEQ